MKIRVIRYKTSYNYKYDALTDNYDNNTKNNMLDSFIVIDNDKEIFKVNCQTISNHPEMKHSDTIAQGKFKLKLFVDQRTFNTPIHGIIGAKDLAGQSINEHSMQLDNGQWIGRWLVHSCYYTPLGRDTRAYSGGCIIMSTNSMLALNEILRNIIGDTIEVELIEI